MRAIAEPKYDMRIVAQCNGASNTDNNKTKDMITMLRTATIGVGNMITFYVDFLNSGVMEGGILNDNFQ